MLALTSFHQLGRNKGAPRLWLENNRLNRLGFKPGTNLTTETHGNRITLRATPKGNRIVSGKGLKPIIDLNSNVLLNVLADYPEIKVRARYKRIDITPSIQAFNIVRSLKHKGPFRVLELFAGGGTFASALKGIPGIQIAAAADIEPKYSHAYDLGHPKTEELFIGDVRRIMPEEYPEFDILVAGIICADSSTLGRTRKGLAGAPERGQFADLFIPVLNVIAQRMPVAVVLENVVTYQNDLASALIRTHLTHLGYHLHETILDPNQEWGDIQDRKRWCLVATLRPGFEIIAPKTPCTQKAGEFLDDPSLFDYDDYSSLEKTIQGLRVREQHHESSGNGFRFIVVNPQATKIPTITKSCRKGNLNGPWVNTTFGPRLLHPSELARISGHNLHPSIPATTAGEIVGQGGTVRVWHQVFKQLTTFLSCS